MGLIFLKFCSIIIVVAQVVVLAQNVRQHKAVEMGKYREWKNRKILRLRMLRRH